MNNYIKNNTGILIRIDDVCENMDWELMKKLEVLFDRYSITPCTFKSRVLFVSISFDNVFA